MADESNPIETRLALGLFALIVGGLIGLASGTLGVSMLLGDIDAQRRWVVLALVGVVATTGLMYAGSSAVQPWVRRFRDM